MASPSPSQRSVEVSSNEDTIPSCLEDMNQEFLDMVLHQCKFLKDPDWVITRLEETKMEGSHGYVRNMKRVTLYFSKGPPHTVICKSIPNLDYFQTEDIMSFCARDVHGLQHMAVFPTPPVYYARIDTLNRRYAVVMEDTAVKNDVNTGGTISTESLQTIIPLLAQAAAQNECDQAPENSPVKAWYDPENLEIWKEALEDTCDLFDKVCAKKPELQKRVGENFGRVFTQVFRQFFDEADPKKNFASTCTLAHGDLRGGNLILNDVSWGLRNFEFSFYGPVPSDLAYLMTVAGTSGTFDSYEDEILQYFYDEYTKQTMRNIQYPYEVFLQEYKMMSMVTLTYLISLGGKVWRLSAEEAEAVTGNELPHEKYEDCEEYLLRIFDTLSKVIEKYDIADMVDEIHQSINDANVQTLEHALNWCQECIEDVGITFSSFTVAVESGLALVALLYKWHPQAFDLSEHSETTAEANFIRAEKILRENRFLGDDIDLDKVIEAKDAISLIKALYGRFSLYGDFDPSGMEGNLRGFIDENIPEITVDEASVNGDDDYDWEPEPSDLQIPSTPPSPMHVSSPLAVTSGYQLSPLGSPSLRRQSAPAASNYTPNDSPKSEKKNEKDSRMERRPSLLDKLRSGKFSPGSSKKGESKDDMQATRKKREKPRRNQPKRPAPEPIYDRDLLRSRSPTSISSSSSEHISGSVNNLANSVSNLFLEDSDTDSPMSPRDPRFTDRHPSPTNASLALFLRREQNVGRSVSESTETSSLNSGSLSEEDTNPFTQSDGAILFRKSHSDSREKRGRKGSQTDSESSMEKGQSTPNIDRTSKINPAPHVRFSTPQQVLLEPPLQFSFDGTPELGYYVIRTIEDGTADRHGVVAGLRILSVNGSPTVGVDKAQLARLMKKSDRCAFIFLWDPNGAAAIVDRQKAVKAFRAMAEKEVTLTPPLGIVLEGNSELGCFVVNVKPQSSAHRMGIRPGVRILAVNGVKITGSSLADVSGMVQNNKKLCNMRITRDPLGYRKMLSQFQKRVDGNEGLDRSLGMPVKLGQWFLKQPEKRGRARRRYFCFPGDGGAIVYFKNDVDVGTESRAHGKIPITKDSQVGFAGDRLTITNPDREWVLKADLVEVALQWHGAIADHIHNMRD
eukprot:m.161016 g.161016  ORF g.161016 m.161016 type:complete len:1133 (-) comp15183_c0_seq1:8034-11432(-)